ncbi:MAG TPA: hypothetical protein VGP30_07855 [Candidatus Limnocylindrales bacterium]|nr:hypothetical protein [Candidatus Limnocylindrales bacterium]
MVTSISWAASPDAAGEAGLPDAAGADALPPNGEEAAGAPAHPATRPKASAEMRKNG